MEIKKHLFAFCAFFFIACASQGGMNPKSIKDLYVDDFHSDDVGNCKTSDVDLNHLQARLFFQRARIVEYKIIHDHYELAPCYLEGPLAYKSEPCTWKIRAGATGSISCGDKEWYFVCDNCEDLFESKK